MSSSRALACGCPVIATDVSDNAVVAPDGRVGRIVPPGDEKALGGRDRADAERRDFPRERRPGSAAGGVETEFSTAKMAAKMMAVYAEALTLRR